MVNVKLLNSNEPRHSAHILYHSLFDVENEIDNGRFKTDLEKILNALNLKCYLVDMNELFQDKTNAGEEISACLLNENGVGVIYINKDKPLKVQRFLIAHEIGRYVLRESNEFIENILYYHTDKDENVSRDEVMANRFASSLLMPKEKVIAITKVGLSLHKASDLFCVPKEILKARLNQLKLN